MSRHRLALVLSVALLLGVAGVSAPALLTGLASGRLPLMAQGAGQAPMDIVLDQRAATAYVVNSSGMMSAWATTTGLTRAGFSLPRQAADIYDAAVVDESAGHVFVATEYGTGSSSYVPTVRMIDGRTGAVLRTIATGATGARTTIMAIDQSTDQVFMANNAIGAGVSSISIVDGRTGVVLHTRSLGSNSPVVSLAVASREARLFVATWSGLDILDTRSGAVVRTLPITSGYGGAVVIDEQTGRAFYAPEVWRQRRDLVVLDARTGAVVYRTTLRLPPTSLLVDELTNRVLIPTFRGGAETVAPLSGMSVLDARTGHVVHEVTSPGGYFPISMGPSPSIRLRGRFLAVTSATLSENLPHPHGLVLWLDGCSVVVLRTLPIRHNPMHVAIDGRTGHAFVANQDDNSVTVLDVHRATVVQTIPVL